MATWYYDLSLGVNGTGTTASPFNTFPGTTITAGDSHLFKRATAGTCAFGISSGADGSITRYGAWANSDGTDNTGLEKPTINSTTVMSTFGTKKGHLRIENLSINATVTVASDTSMIFLSDSATIVNTVINTNVGGVGIWGASHITIDGLNVKGVSHANTSNNNCLVVSGSTAMDAIAITNSLFQHGGGGGLTSHNVILESTTNTLTNLIFQGNICVTSTSLSSSNHGAIALRVGGTPGANINSNVCEWHNTGIQVRGLGGVSSASLTFNVCRFNYHFGIHLTTDAIGCTLRGNNCSNNGTAINDGVTLLAYGRGIEISSAAGQSRCASHVVRANNCSGNYNWGGASDNASEGVGIGLDDGAVNCLVMGNTIADNEGNGIQLYGGGNAVTWTDTHNTIVSNLFRNNCAAAYVHRQAGGTLTGAFVGDIGCASTHGGDTLIANNTFAGQTPAAITVASDCGSITFANNITLSVAHPVVEGRTGAQVPSTGYTHNDYYNATQVYSTTGASSNGTLAYPIFFFVGTSEFTFDPLVDSNYELQDHSPAINAGADVLSATWVDHDSNFFTVGSPSLGMLEYFGVATSPGGWERKNIYRNR